MTLKGETDTQKAIFLLREIESWLAVNNQPSLRELLDLRKSIKDFTKHFPECWNCGDCGYVGEPLRGIPCACNESDNLCVI